MAWRVCLKLRQLEGRSPCEQSEPPSCAARFKCRSDPLEGLSEERRERDRAAGTEGLSMMSALLFLESTQDQKDNLM